MALIELGLGPPMPLFIAVQLAPPFVVLKRPLLKVPAYIVVGVVGSIANARIPGLLGKPLFSAVHVAPPSVLFNTPTPAPTYSADGFAGSNTITEAFEPFRGMVVTGFQLAPPSVVFNNPGDTP